MLAAIKVMTPQIAGLTALPEMALFSRRKEAEPDPVAARLADILLQVPV
ncbi:hypothetical protein [Mesorhizobium sp.]|nr:hypothetical protein [Mesorhizobium sp.]